MDIKNINFNVLKIIKKEIPDTLYSTWVKFIEDDYIDCYLKGE
jgi:hypothetical protein